MGTGPIAMAADPASNTVYTVNIAARTVSVIDGRTCDAADLAGCAAQTSSTVTVGVDADAAGLDSPAHTLYVANFHDGTVSVINTSVCNGQTPARLLPPRSTNPARPATNQPLPRRPRHRHPVRGQRARQRRVGDRHRQVRRCTDRRLPPPGAQRARSRVPDLRGPGHRHPLRRQSQRAGIDAINGATCNPTRLSGCAPVAEIPIAHSQANVGAIDDATHTPVRLRPVFRDHIGDQHRRLQRHPHRRVRQSRSNDQDRPVPRPAGAQPRHPDPVRALRTNASKVAVVNAATCNAENTAGCGHAPAVARVGQGTFTVAVSAATDTIYGQNARDRRERLH